MSAGVTPRLGCAVATTDRVIAEDAIFVLEGFIWRHEKRNRPRL
jgi:hypothetical protein